MSGAAVNIHVQALCGAQAFLMDSLFIPTPTSILLIFSFPLSLESPSFCVYSGHPWDQNLCVGVAVVGGARAGSEDLLEASPAVAL